MNNRLVNDYTMAITAHVIEVFAPLLREGEKQEAFAEVYEKVKAGIELYETEAARMQRRLRPLDN